MNNLDNCCVALIEPHDSHSRSGLRIGRFGITRDRQLESVYEKALRYYLASQIGTRPILSYISLSLF